MQTKLLSWFLLLGLTVVLGGKVFAQGAVPAAASAQPAGRIVVARVRGEVTATDKVTNAVTKLADKKEVAQGALVTTGKDSSVVLIFSNGATISLGADALLDIEEFTQQPFKDDFSPADATAEPSTSTTKLKLARGELVGKVAKLKKEQGSTFTVGTPVGAAGIRGTTFRIVYHPDGQGKAFFSMTTLEGNVEVTLATGTVSTPVSVTNNKEVVLADVTVEVNSTTGQVTVTTPAGTTVVATDASAKSTQQIVAAAQQISEAVAAVVIKSTPPAADNPPAQEPKKEEPKKEEPKKEDPTTTVPGISTSNSRTTSGDGATN